MIRLTNIRVEEQFSRFLVWPVIGQFILLLGIVFDVSHHLFQASVIQNQFEGSVGYNFRYGIDVIAAQEDAEIYELDSALVRYGVSEIHAYLLPVHSQAFKNSVEMDFLNGFLALLAECEMS